MAGVEDILAASASATQQMLPEEKPLTTFGPTPMVQPPPMPRIQQQPQQFGKAGNEFQTVSGRKRADRQALISNTVNLIKSGSDYIQAKKQRNLSMHIERLLEAQQGLQEAQAEGNKEGIARNSSIINDLTSDPKVVKQLQKAFNIDLFGNGKNKNENMAMQEAMKNFQTAKQKDPNALNPVAQKLMQSQPYRQQLSPEAQAQAQAIKAGLIPKAGEVLKAAQENFKAVLTAKTAEERNAALEKHAEIMAQAQMYHADKVLEAGNIKALGMQTAAEIRSRAQLKVAGMVAGTWDKRLAKMDQWAKMKTGSSPVITGLTKEAKVYNDELKNLAAENTKIQAELDKPSTGVGKYFGSKAVSSADASKLRIKLFTNNQQMQMYQQSLDGVTKKLQTLDTMGVINMKELSAGSSGGTGGTDETEVDDSEVPE